MTDRRRKRGKESKPFSWVATVRKWQEEERKPCEDYFENSEKIEVLGSENYQAFLDEKEVALIMFHDPCDKNCLLSKNHFILAADEVQRENSGFGAVDCSKEPNLCDMEQVRSVPFFKLFSRGRVAATVVEYYSFVHSRMKNYVETCPVNTDIKRDKKECTENMK